MVGVGWSGEGDRQWWCGFNASVSTRGDRRWDKVLPKDEVDASSSSWLHGKKVQHGIAVWHRWSEERRHRGEKREEMMAVGLTQILLGQKIKKIHVIDSAATNGR
jgi:hypothetical protein